MRTKFAIIFSLLFLPACDPQPDPPDENLPATGGFLEIECPGGYLCPPNDDHPWCDDSDFQGSPGGLCSLPCMNDDDCPGIRGGECISNFICGTPCTTNQDCYDVGYGDWAVCWEFSPTLSVCSDEAYVSEQSSTSSGGAVDSTG